MSFRIGGPRRPVVPPSNLGQEYVANRRVAEAAGRAAEKTRIAVAVDGFPSRVWLRQPRGSIPCPCSSESFGPQHSPPSPTDQARVVLPGRDGDDLNSIDPGYPPSGPQPSPNEQLTADPADGFTNPLVGEIARMLLGNGRRCGICWGTGWVDGHRLHGGQRYVCGPLPAPNPWVAIASESGIDVDLESPTPTMVGPGTITWALEMMPNLLVLDAVRVRDGTRPAQPGWTLTATSPSFPVPTSLDQVLGTGWGLLPGSEICTGQLPSTLTLTIPEGGRVSHVEIVMRSEPLVGVQLENLGMQASTELVAPLLVQAFEIDPTIGWLERNSIIEIPGMGGRIGSLWLAQDVTVQRTAQGVTWGILGNVRNVQPNEVLACASLEDALLVGVQDPGLASRGFESTGAGVPSGLPDGQTDESVAVARSGSSRRAGGGAGGTDYPAIVLTPSPEDRRRK